MWYTLFMGGDPVQIHRLFEIVYLLLSRKTMTAGELAVHFEVSKRTILRDIDVLSAAGVPVYTTQGKGGGISIMEHYVLGRGLLSEEEQSQILMALQGLSATEHAAANRLLEKLGAIFEKANTDWIEVDFSRWGQGAADNQRFALLREAIIHQRAVAFEYVGTSGERSARTAYPLKLVFKSKAWYLQAFCVDRQDYRVFRLSRMLQLRNTQEFFARSAYAPPPIESSETPPESMVALELAFPAHVAWRLYDEFDDGAIEAGDDGRLYVRTSLPEDAWLYGFLLSFGRDMRVIAPAHVRENLKRQRG